MNMPAQQAKQRTKVKAASFGEIVLPLLFDALETCWLYAAFIGLTGLPFWHSGVLLPLWVPFITLVAAQGAAHLLELWRARCVVQNRLLSGNWLLAVPIALGTLLLVWWRIYSPTVFFLDPAWLLALFKDIAALNVRAWTVFALLIFVPFFSLRSIQFSLHEDKAQFLSQTIALGIGIIIVVILVEAGQDARVVANEGVLFLLIPIFLILGLLAHALAQAVYIRQYHLSALDGNVSDQERSIFLWTGMFGLFLLVVTLLVAFATNGSLLASTQQFLTAAYNWLGNAVTAIVGFLLTPVTWFLSLFQHQSGQQPLPTAQGGLGCKTLQHLAALHHRSYDCGQAHLPGNNPFLILIMKLLLLVLVLLITSTLIRRAARHRRSRGIVTQSGNEVHESIWSWMLFWQQLKAFWLALWLRFVPRQAAREEQAMHDWPVENVVAVRSIREIYRLLLKRAAKRGYARKKNETPYEYLHRLSQRVPQVELQLATITEAYTAVRYGDFIPGESEVSQLRTVWKKLEEQWK